MALIITTCISITTSIGVVCLFIYLCGGKDSLRQRRINKIINSEIIKGNKYAVAIKKCSYTMKWEEESLVMAAIGGNLSALEALKIDLDRKY